MSVGMLMNATSEKIAKIFKRISEGAEDDCLSKEHDEIVLVWYINSTRHMEYKTYGVNTS